jgi:acetyl esterase/lipase
MRCMLPVLLLAATSPAGAQSVPTAVAADPPQDRAHPATLIQLRYPTGGVEVPARFFQAAGAGQHATMLLLHGFPGTELNLDLARAAQRSGWNVLAIHYRGVWGAPGRFSFAHTIEDARAALAWLRTPANAARFRVDAGKIVVLGHSMGGFDTVMLGDDPAIRGYALLSAANIAGFATLFDTPAKRAASRGDWSEDLSFTNMTYEAMADEIVANARAWDWKTRAAKMAGRPVLIVTSNDGLESAGTDAADAVRAARGPAPALVKLETDHSFNDQRLALAAVVLRWLETIR